MSQSTHSPHYVFLNMRQRLQPETLFIVLIGAYTLSKAERCQYTVTLCHRLFPSKPK